MQHCQHLLDSFGRASGLFCDRTKTKAALVPYFPVPPPLLALGWQWESSAIVPYRLGIHCAQQLSEELMEKELELRQDRGIARCRAKSSSLMARVMVASHIITSSLWYMLTVWPGKPSFLESLQKKVIRFIWAGSNATTRHRVKAKIITCPKRLGGLGLISIPLQTRALAGLIILWAIQDGVQPFCQLLQFWICALSTSRRNTFNFAWIFNHCNTIPPNESTLWTNICQAWNSLKRNIRPCLPDSPGDWNELPLWQPHVILHQLPALPQISKILM